MWFLIAAVALPGVLLYVRYVEFLYARRKDQPIKITVISSAIFLVTIIFVWLLFAPDLIHLGLYQLSIENLGEIPFAGLLGIHIYLKNLILSSGLLGLFFWHLSKIANH